MTLGIGVKIGADTCVVTVATDAAWEATITRETTRLVGRDDFLDRVGDPVALVDADGDPIAAADLFADAVVAMVQAVADEVADVSSARLAIAHPDSWSADALDAARRSVDDRLGPTGVELGWQPTSAAVVAAAEHAHGSFADDSVVVCHDLGASAVTVSVVRAGDDPEVIGQPLMSSAVSGREFDRLLLAEVLEVTGAASALGAAATTMADPTVLDDLERLRADCRAAKETLSVDTDTVVDVAVASVHTEARLVREDVENLLRAPILESAALIREALIAADVEPTQVSAIVATGGGAAIPLVAELLSTAARASVVVDPDPITAPAAGAILLQSRVSAASTAILPVDAAATAVQPTEPPVRGIIPAPALPVGEPEPRLSRRRRGTLVAVGTAVLAVITATGLSVGTGLVGHSEPATPAPAGAAVTEGPSSRTSPAGGTAGLQAEQLESRNGASGATTTAPGTTAADQPGTPTAPGTQAPGTQAPRTQAPGTQVPGTQAPGTQTPGTQAPGTGSPGTQNPSPNPPAPSPPPEFPADSGNGGGSGGGGNGGGGLTQLPGEIVGGAGDTVCGVTDLLCLGR
ncbi:Hsp70 family protein [Gordonia aquimaris]|uniref:Hsp70 family protein n=1 Tax=Gordonia aquimaris TaxID=2984863 RepID=A0A9X3D2R0_9ACTN|nr:Hsp70 family protein [Gordonia aquimaris]MCX2963726.1 Hsp70 family protein [Gordonia aquimaris]